MTVSIITPTYNHEQFIGPCIESVLAQTSPDWEMIIVDDGSTDGTAAVVAAHPDPRIKYVRQDNKGIARLAETYNTALGLARGELVAILEGDDLWPPHKLGVQAGDFADEDVVLSFGETQVLFGDGKRTEKIPRTALPPGAQTNEPVGRAALYMMSIEHLTYTFPVSVVIRKSALDRIGGFQHSPYLPLVDYPTFLRLTLEGRFVFHPQILGLWRRHDESVTKNQMYVIYEGVQRQIDELWHERRAVLPISQEEYDRAQRGWQRFNGLRLQHLGRLCLTLGDWAAARRAFAKSLALPGNPVRWLLSWLGIALSYTKLTMEPFMRAIAMPDIQTLTGPNRIVDKLMLEDGWPALPRRGPAD